MVFKNKLFQDIFSIVTANLDAFSQQSIHPQMVVVNLSWENKKPARS
jgi:hypothetical protein